MIEIRPYADRILQQSRPDPHRLHGRIRGRGLICIKRDFAPTSTIGATPQNK